MAFYSAYHRNDTNKLIHFLFVPALCMWVIIRIPQEPVAKSSSGLILLDHIRFADSASKILAPGAAVQLSAGLVTMIGYCAYYIFLDPIGGVSYYRPQ